MKKSFFLIPLVIAVILFFIFQSRDDNEPFDDKAIEPVQIKSSKVEKTKERDSAFESVDSAEGLDDSLMVDIKTQDKAEVGFLKIHRVMKTIYQKENSESELIDYLEANGLGARVSRNSDPYSGSTTIVRSQKGFPGTRYYQAKFYTDESGNTHLQHMSVELRPSENGLNRAQELMEANYGVADGVASEDGKTIQYLLNDGKSSLVIKELTEKDMEGDHYHTYDPKEDLGTIQVVIMGDDDHSGYDRK